MRNLTRTCNGIQTEAYSEFQSLSVQKHVPYVPVCQSHPFNGGNSLNSKVTSQNVSSYSAYSEFTFTCSFTKANDTWRSQNNHFQEAKKNPNLINQLGNLVTFFVFYINTSESDVHLHYKKKKNHVQVPEQT